MVINDTNKYGDSHSARHLQVDAQPAHSTTSGSNGTTHRRIGVKEKSALPNDSVMPKAGRFITGFNGVLMHPNTSPHPISHLNAIQERENQENALREITPFSLLGDGLNVPSFLRSITTRYQLGTSTIQDAYPCTPFQEGLFSLPFKRTEDFTMQTALELSSTTSTDAFCKAWEEVVLNTPVLRTRVIQHDTLGLLQLVVDEDIHWVKSNNLDRYLETDKKSSIGLGQHLNRYGFVEDAAGCKWFIWTTHTSLFDQRVQSLVLDAVVQVYEGRALKKRLSFQHFINYLKSQDGKGTSNYWKMALKDCEAMLFPALPPAMNEPSADSIAEHRFSLSRLSCKTTTSALFQSGWALLAARLTNSTDVVFGTTVTGRGAPVARVDEIIGPTTAIVPARFKVDGDMTVTEYVRNVQQQAVDAIPFEHMGLHRIAKISSDCQQACKFQTLLTVQLENEVMAESVLGKWKNVDQHKLFGMYALVLNVNISKNNNVQVTASFDSKVVEPWLVRTLLKRLEWTIHQLIHAEQGQKLADLDLCTEDDIETIWSWNQHVPNPTDRTILDIFADNVSVRPEAPAICAWDGDLTYRELHDLSNKLATRLLQLDIESTYVPLCFAKSKWTSVAMFAVMKARGAIVLLDPSLPKQRLRPIFKQVNARLVLTSSEYRALGNELCDMAITVNPGTFAEIDNVPTRSILKPGLESVAYVVFTSGTTGTPKGSMITHRSCATAISIQARALGFNTDSRVYDFSTYGFDVNIFDLFHTLAVGGCFCVPSDEDRKNDLAGSITSLAANTISITPSLSRMISPQQVPQVHTVMFVAEALSIKDIEPWWGQVRLLNGYGPSECTPFCVFSYDTDTPKELTRIGKGCGATTWIVDVEDHNRLLPPGCIGELLLEGPLIGPGYLDEPEKNAAAYAHDPTWLGKGAPGFPGRGNRLYKTGDLVHYNKDGSLSFMGRKDEQVKIRGQRIELLEVEYHIQKAMPEISQVVAQVIIPKGENTRPELVAFLLKDSDTSRTSEDLPAEIISVPVAVEESLNLSLPTYMVPRTFFSVREMPIGASGKLVRKKLLDIGASFTTHQLAQLRTDGQGPKQQPTLEAERRMQKIWFEVLGLTPEEIGVNDSFFKLGGNSIDAMKVVAEARKIGLELKMADVFQHPRLQNVASRAISNEAMSQNIPKHHMKSHVKQSFAQGRLWFLEQLYPGLSWYIMPFVVRLRGPLQLDALKKALSALEARHETLRTTFESQNNVNIQVVQPARLGDLELVSLPAGQEGLLGEMLKKDASTPFQLDREPGWRVKVYRMGKDDDHVLSTVMHHIITDGWSVDVFHRELALLYAAALRGQDPLSQIKPLPIQYQDYSVWQQKMTQIDEHERQLEYWTKQLESSQPAELLLDKPRPATLSGQAGVHRFNIEGQLYHDLQQFCQKFQTTPFIVLLSAFRATHFRLTGQVDAVIGSPNANRDRWELRDMIGFFVNMQCLRTTIGEEDESFEQLVKQVHSVTVASFSNQDVPFERLVDKLRTHRDLSRHPLVQIVFALHSQENLGQLNFEGISCEVIRSEPRTRFDMECHFYQETDSLRGEVLFSADLYNDATISGLISIFNMILKQGIRDPKASVASLSLMTDDDRALLESWGLDRIDKVDYPRESSVVDLFRQQVRLCPNKLAVKDSYTQLTYSELDDKSDHLAAWLAGRDLPPETPIGVFASRSCQTIVAFFGILKANLAYLPLDTRTSAARIETILSCLDGEKLVLLGPEQETVCLGDNVELVPISTILGQPQDLQQLSSTSLPSATSLAYVMFTSGSTGQPKGVMTEHRGIVRLVKQSNIIEQIPSAPVMAHISNIAFDGSTWEIYAALLNGGSLICMDAMTILDAKTLGATFAREGVQTTLITTALFKQYLHECPGLVSSLDTLLVGGERLDPQTLVAAHKIMNGKFVHVYGPTENTTYSTMYLASKDQAYTAEVPIGRTLSNSGAHVMDSQQKLVPVGVVGELVLTGDGLARGYTDTQKNTDRFVTVRIGNEELKAYRTGDFVRYRPRDGQLEFLGRMDGQIKIRGQRVELGEIEHAIRAHTIVKDSVVVVQRDGVGDPQLTGFVTLHDFVDDVQGDSADKPTDNDNDQHVKVWEGHFEGDTYSSIDKMESEKVGRDFIGWTSMYDGAEIDKTEMNEWLDDTIESIRNGQDPRNVLEIGSGTGMILFNLIEGLSNYVGLDPSASAVELITRMTRSMPNLKNKVQMYKGTAADVNCLERATKPNLVVINSVAQYFPSQAYLVKMIKDVLKFGSVEQIYFGDMRSYALYRQFLVTRALYMLGDKVDLDMIRQKMAAMEEAELEFLVDPGFFTSLPDIMPDLIDHVEILPKRMRATNELSAYRYAAVVHAKVPGKERQQVHEVEQEEWVDFQAGGLSRQSLLQLLQSRSDSPILAVSNVPYEKTIFERFVVDILGDKSRGTTVTENWYSSALERSTACSSLAAIDLVELAQQTGFQVEISCARQYSLKGGLDAIFHRRQSDTSKRILFKFPTDYQGRLPRALSTRPVEQQMRQNVRTQLLEMLQSQLPSYMVPRMISVLNTLPMNDNGKIDRRALSQRITKPVIVRVKSTRQLNSDTERQLQEIWADVLNLERDTIGLDGSFFHLGGNSISAMKVVGKARSVGLQLSVADMFRYPTLEMMASNAAPILDESQDVEPFSLLPQSIDIPLLLQEISDRYGFTNKVEDVYPCTPLQEGLLAWSSTRPGDYVLQSSMRIVAGSSVETTKVLWERVFELFPILRTRVIPSDAGLLQIVSDERINWIEATSLESYLESDRSLPMDFGQPLTRFALVHNAVDGVKWVVWTIHHALYDGWSLSLIKEAMTRVNDGKPVIRGPKFTSFIKHIRENNEQYTKDYWCQYLGGYNGATFPTFQKQMDRPKTDTIFTHRLPRLQLQRTGLNITESAVLRAAWALVAGQMSNSDDVVFGETLFGRNASVANIERMVAPTFTTVPIRIQINKDQKVLEYLLQVQKQSTEMIPFEQTGLQRIAKLSVDCQNACEFQTQLVIQTESGMEEELSQLQNQDKWFNPYALVIDIELGKDEHLAKVGFDSRVLQPWVVRKLMERMENVIEQFNSLDEDQTLNDLQSLTAQDLQQVWQWNQTVPISVGRLIHDMVLEQTLAQPDAPAICAWDGELTYKELDSYATLVAEKLTKLGVKQDQLLPLCFHKSMWTSVAMLGVLKAGGAFVLLDPSLPEQRLRIIVEQTGNSLILSSTSNVDLSSRLSETVIELSSQTLNISDLGTSQATTSQPSSPQSASSMILAVFTSGSTGIPKGITHTHASFASGLKHQAESLGFKKNSRVFDFASYAFDASPHMIFAALVTGACVCVPSEADRQGNISGAMSRMQVTLADLTPSVARLLDPSALPDLETLVLSGELVSSEDASRWFGEAWVVNAYGPAECIIGTINSDATRPNDVTSIGKGAGMVTWVVDPDNHNRLLPPGCTGELLLEGPVLGSGYLNEPDKTAAAFIQNPAWLSQGAPGFNGRRGRLYKTGDLVKYGEDGNLWFVSRKDAQVKIRGQRVELGEVELRIQQCITGAVQVVADVFKDDDSNNPILAAFIQPDRPLALGDGAPTTPTVLRVSDDTQAQLAESLPKYMIPTMYFTVPEIPRTATGKTDRKRLREIGQSSYMALDHLPGHHQALTTNLIFEDEQLAYTLAKKVLSMRPSWGWDGVVKSQNGSGAVEAGFADLQLHSCGLDSLNTMSLLHFINRQFNVRVGLKVLIDRATTIRGLTQLISELQQVDKTSKSETKLVNGRTLIMRDFMEEINRHDSRIAAAQQALATQPIGISQNNNLDEQLIVFLTGANGFIGTQILRQLLEHRQVKQVIALVRGETAEVARQRTISAATKALWWTEAHEKKLQVWKGDLSLPNLGLDEDHWSLLSSGQTVNAIIHNGAVVHWGETYDALEATNVGSTVALLHLAVSHQSTRFVYVSGGIDHDSAHEAEEAVVNMISSAEETGYSQTKFVAEAVVRRAAKRNTDPTGTISILRPGLVVGTPEEGVSNADDFMWRLAAASIQAGVYNRDAADEWIRVSDVATVAKAAIDPALNPDTDRNAVVPVKDGMTSKEFSSILIEMGYKLKAASAKQWLAAIQKDMEAMKEKHPLWPVAHMLPSLVEQRPEESQSDESEDERAASPRLKAAVRKSVEFLGQVGFFPQTSGMVQHGSEGVIVEAFSRSGLALSN